MKIALAIDILLRDTFLTVVQLRNGALVEQGDALYQHCRGQVELARSQLEAEGYCAEHIDHITYAQCALLDETVLGRHGQDNGYHIWRANPLQAHFFNTLQAGEHLYERVHAVLNQPGPNEAVLTCFHRILVLGFQGRYYRQPQGEREDLIAALAARVPSFTAEDSAVLLHSRGARSPYYLKPHSLWLWCGMALLLVAGLWWGLHHHLQTLLAELLPVPR